MNLREDAIAKIALAVLPPPAIVVAKEFGDIMQKEIHLRYFVKTATRVVIHTVRIADD